MVTSHKRKRKKANLLCDLRLDNWWTFDLSNQLARCMKASVINSHKWCRGLLCWFLQWGRVVNGECAGWIRSSTRSVLGLWTLAKLNISIAFRMKPTWFCWGRSLATFFQIAPVPPSKGNLKIAFGPHPASSLSRTTLLIALLMSTVATRSPSHSHCMSVVGYAQTYKAVNKDSEGARWTYFKCKIYCVESRGATNGESWSFGRKDLLRRVHWFSIETFVLHWTGSAGQSWKQKRGRDVLCLMSTRSVGDKND